MFRPFERPRCAPSSTRSSPRRSRGGPPGRPWAVELDESAYAFLIEKGFSPTLGARPLQRAIEQHVLAPLRPRSSSRRFPTGPVPLRERAGRSPDRGGVRRPRRGRRRRHPGRADEPTGPPGPRAERTGRRAVAAVRALRGSSVSEAVDALAPQKAGALAALGEPTFWETDGSSTSSPKPSTSTVWRPRPRRRTRLRPARAEPQTAAARHRARRPARGACTCSTVRWTGSPPDPYELFLEVRSQDGHAFATGSRRCTRRGGCTGMQVERLDAAPGPHCSPFGLGSGDPPPGGRLHVLEHASRTTATRATARRRAWSWPPAHAPDAGRIQPRRRRAARHHRDPLSAGAALVAAAVVVVGFTALAVRKLVRLDVP